MRSDQFKTKPWVLIDRNVPSGERGRHTWFDSQESAFREIADRSS